MKDLKYLTSSIDGVIGTNSDLSFVSAEGGNVDLATVDLSDRVSQDITKILLTETGTLPYPNYGAGLSTYIYRTFNSIDILDQVQKAILSAIYYLIFREPSANPAERIGSIDDISVSYDDRTIVSDISLTTEKGAGINLEATV